MAHDVLGAETGEAQAANALQHVQHVDEARAMAAGEVDLRDVAGHHGGGAKADAGEKHLHLLHGGVLAFVQDDECGVQGAPAHECQRRHLDDVALDVLVDAVYAQHLVEGIVEGAQVGVDLLRQIARQKAQLLAGLHRWPNQENAVNLLAFERFDGARHRKIRLAGARRPNPEVQIVGANGLYVAALIAAAWLDGLLARADDGLVRLVGGGRKAILAVRLALSFACGQQFLHAGFLQENMHRVGIQRGSILRFHIEPSQQRTAHLRVSFRPG